MKTLYIKGGNALNGTVCVSGSKNATLPILAACLLTEKPCILHNVPDLSDVGFMCQILSSLGADVSQLGPESWTIRAKNISNAAPYDLVRKMRASVCLMGPLLGRLKSCVMSLPGGCVIGPRPIDLHLKGFEKLGCIITMHNGYMHMDSTCAKGSSVFLGGRYGSTVTGTANLLMMAVLTPGVTRIEYAACEPEIVDLCHMLLKMGAKIEGIGSPSLIVEGVDSLNGCEHTIIPDRIEAGTFLIAGLLSGNHVTVKNARADHLYAFLDKLDEAGAELSINLKDQTILAQNKRGYLKPIDIVTLPYPGFPTDLQAQIGALMALTPGMSIITERIYTSRFMYVSELQRMGARIALEGPSAIISGQKQLSGAHVMASDLRASASLFLAGLVAQGETFIHRIYHLDRGYQAIDQKLRALGACVDRLDGAQITPSCFMEPALN